MEPINLSTREFYLYSLLINAGIGLLFGLIPLVTGFIKRRRKHAFLGFVLTIVGGSLLGLLLAIPVAAIFTWLILKGSGRPDAPSPGDPSGS